MFKEFSRSLRCHSAWNYLRHCPACACSNSISSVWLCLSCLEMFKSYFLKPKDMVRIQNSFLHVRLIDWHKENDQWMRSIIKSLKGNHNSPLFNFLAKEFLYRLEQIPSIFRDAPFCFVPCPSRTQDKDHGFYFAQQLSISTGFPLIESLKHESVKESQKGKEIHSRKLKKFIKEKPLIKSHRPIFVDDVLTTGATATAACQALGADPLFMVWSIFWRRNSFLF